jgi:recombination protein RecT
MAPRKPTERSESEVNTAIAVRTLLRERIPQISKSIPKETNAERAMGTAVQTIAENQTLQKCSPESLFSCVVQAMRLGLDLSPKFGHAYLIPYGNEAQFQLGYRGLMHLVRRANKVKEFHSRVVHEKDEFRQVLGAHLDLIHVPARKDAGAIEAFYALVKFDDGLDFEVMSLAEVEAIRDRSKAKGGPWQTDFSEMGRKTVIKRLAKRLDLTPEAAEAIENDHEQAMGEINVTPQPAGPSPIETGGFLGMSAPAEDLPDDPQAAPPGASDAWEPELPAE